MKIVILLCFLASALLLEQE